MASRRRAGANVAKKRRAYDLVRSECRPGERGIPFYDRAAAECQCPPTSDYSGIDCISVGRAGGVDRCLTCSTSWPSKSHRDDGRARPRGRGESLARWLEHGA